MMTLRNPSRVLVVDSLILEAEVLKELGATEEEYEEDNNTEGSFEMDVPSIYDIIH